MSDTLHPFEAAGMGRGPYRFGGVTEMPDLSSDSAANFGNSNPYAEIQALGLKAGAGTCACCGMAITVICVVVDANGDRWGVGSDCVEKTGEPSVSNPARIAIAKRRNLRAAVLRQEKRAARHNAWLAAPSAANPAETNLQAQERKSAEHLAQVEARKAAVNVRAEQFADLLHALGNGNDFFGSLASQLVQGPLSPKQAHYVAKAVLGRETKGNVEAWADICNRCQK